MKVLVGSWSWSCSEQLVRSSDAQSHRLLPCGGRLPLSSLSSAMGPDRLAELKQIIAESWLGMVLSLAEGRHRSFHFAHVSSLWKYYMAFSYTGDLLVPQLLGGLPRVLLSSLMGYSQLCWWRSPRTRDRISWRLSHFVKIGYVSQILSFGVMSLQEAIID